MFFDTDSTVANNEPYLDLRRKLDPSMLPQNGVSSVSSIVQWLL